MIEKTRFDEMIDSFLNTGGPGIIAVKIFGLVLLVLLAYRAFGLEYRYTVTCPRCKSRLDAKTGVCRHCGRDSHPKSPAEKREKNHPLIQLLPSSSPSNLTQTGIR